MIGRVAYSLLSPGGRRARLSILIFHRVRSARDSLFPGETCADDFEKLVRHLRKTFNVLPLSDAARALGERCLPARALTITFDDGYADNLKVAAPILHRHGLPATVFVATGFLDGGCMWNERVIAALRLTRLDQLDLGAIGLARYPIITVEDRRRAIDCILDAIKYLPPEQRRIRADEVLGAAKVSAPSDQMLTREELRRLRDFGLDVGGHTANHPILASLPDADAQSEIVAGKKELEAIVDAPVEAFAYPNGKPGVDYGGVHVRMVRAAGFTVAVSTAAGTATAASDLLQLPRFTPWARDSWRFDVQMMRNLLPSAEMRAS